MTNPAVSLDLSDKVAVVTGGTTGIGRASAEALARHGAKVVITGQDDSRLATAAAELEALGVVPFRADVTKVADLDALHSFVEERFGRVDILFANAGIGGFAPIEGIDEAEFDRQFQTNVKGVFFTVQKLLPLMHAGGSILLNASAINAKGAPMGSVYFASKAAVRSLARSLAAELGSRGIRVNAVSPGFVFTAFQGKLDLPPGAFDGFAKGVTQATPLSRAGTPEEIAQAVVFLGSDAASYITATDLTVDGGYMNV